MYIKMQKSIKTSEFSDHAYCIQTDQELNHSKNTNEELDTITLLDHGYCIGTDVELNHLTRTNEKLDNISFNPSEKSDHAYCRSTMHEVNSLLIDDCNRVKRKYDLAEFDKCTQARSSPKTDLVPKYSLRETNFYDLSKSQFQFYPSEKIQGITYTNIPVPGDGNCFFHCLSMCLHGHFENSCYYRKIICNYILQNWIIYEDLAVLNHGLQGVGSKNLEEYEKLILINNGWATDCELRVAADLLHLNINVWLKGTKYNKNKKRSVCYHLTKYPQFQNTNPFIDLLLYNNHFTILKHMVNIQKHNNVPESKSEIRKNKECTANSNYRKQEKMLYSTDLNPNNGNEKFQKYTKPKIQTTPSKEHQKNSTKEGRSFNHKHEEIEGMSFKPNINKPRKSLKQKRETKFSHKNEEKEGMSFKLKSNKPRKSLKQKRKTEVSVSSTKPKLQSKTSANCHLKKSIKPAASLHSDDNCSLVSPKIDHHLDMYQKCRKLGLIFKKTEYIDSMSSMQKRILQAQKQFNVKVDDLPSPPPLHVNEQYNIAMDSIRAFELEQLSYSFNDCKYCKECRLEMKMKSNGMCYKCFSDKNNIKLFSAENNMDPGSVPEELKNLSLVEQQLISRLAPVMHIHMLKHGGIAAKGHCVTFPQEVNEPARILPKLAKDIAILRVKKPGVNNSSKEFNVCRFRVEKALSWLKLHNKAYLDIEISQQRLNLLPDNGEIQIDTIDADISSWQNDLGPAPEQNNMEDVSGVTASTVTLPEQCFDHQNGIQSGIEEIASVKCNKNPNKVTIPWPSQDKKPMSEFTTQYFFTLSFPCLFPYGTGDFHINRPRTLGSMSDWAEHLMWYIDGRFARHKYFKFIVHNIIMRRRAVEQSSYIMRQQIGEEHMSIDDLQQRLKCGDKTIAQKILYFGACLRGTSQYWMQRNKEVKSLIRFQINEGKGLPSIFATGSCAEFYFKPLKRLLGLYLQKTKNSTVDLNDKNTLFTVLQENSHIVSHYFDLRTKSYFNTVMKNAFKVNTYWYRYEFAKSRGMIHWHGLCWRSDREPHLLLNEALERGLGKCATAEELSLWAKKNISLTACHPAGKDLHGNPRKDLWAPPEGTALPPSEEKNPLVKLLLDVSDSQETLLEDHLLLTNRINLHRCSDYCLQKQRGHKVKTCRMEFGSEYKPGKDIRDHPAIVRDKNGSLRLEMERDHPMMVQHSKVHTQGWRANGDISLILSKSDPDNPSVSDIIATEKYVTGYACKGNQSSGELVDLFHIMANAPNENVSTGKNICTKFLMNTVKRDISNTESSYELLGLPLFHCSHQFLSVSFTGSRVLEKSGKTLTKSTPLDRYLSRPLEDKSSWYNHICAQGRVPVVSGSCTNASWPLTEDYSRSMTLLHWPNWRKISDIKPANASWQETFDQFLQSLHCPNFVKADVERARAKEKEENALSDSSSTSDEEAEQPEWVQLMRPHSELTSDASEIAFDDGGPSYDWGTTTIKYPDNFGKDFFTNLHEENNDEKQVEIETIDLHTLNMDQKFAFNVVLNTLLAYKTDCSYKPLRMIVSGTAGSGKSYLIKSLVYAIAKLFHSVDAVQVVCPTGNSANLISGTTIHSFFKVPTSYRATKDMKAPEGIIGKELQNNCNGLLALIVDERSLVGCSTLGWMEFHCRYGMKNELSDWGGLPVVIFLGDDVQLPPVCDSPVYHCNSKIPAAIHGSFIWKSFTTVVHLQTIVRQNIDQHYFKNVLSALRSYTLSIEQARWLQSFQWQNLKLKYGSDVMDKVSENGLFVFPTHAAEWQHNCSQLKKANKYFPVAKLSSVNEGTHAKNASSDKASGLAKTLYICKNAKVMLTCNLNVSHGLFNGSSGTVQDIIYLNGTSPTVSLPDVVMVEFPKYCGPPYISDQPKLVPIVPIQRQIDCYCHGCKRKQIPLRLGWGTTIHRCQGLTIGNGEPNQYIVIDPGQKQFESRNPGALFVALSRAKTSGNETTVPDFYWHPDILVNEDRLCFAPSTPKLEARNAEMQRIANYAKQTKLDFSYDDTMSVFEHITQRLNVEE